MLERQPRIRGNTSYHPSVSRPADTWAATVTTPVIQAWSHYTRGPAAKQVLAAKIPRPSNPGHFTSIRAREPIRGDAPTDKRAAQ